MANIAWPSNPSVGQTYTFNSITYVWTGTTWSPGTAPISLTGPTGTSGLTGPTGPVAAVTEPQGRLTLQTLVPVMVTTQSAKTTLFYTPDKGDKIPIYDGSALVMRTFTELSIATTDTTKSPAAIGASKVNDWFVWDDAGTLRLIHAPDWTSDTARSAGTALVMQNGILLNSVSITNGPAASRGTYVGTTRSNGSSQLEWIYGAVAANGTAGFFGVWNAYNRVNVASICGDNTDSWAYAGTWRSANNSNTMRMSYVCGLEEDSFSAEYNDLVQSTGAIVGVIGVGYDSTSAVTGVYCPNFLIGTDDQGLLYQRAVAVATSLGFHFFQAIEEALSGTNPTFYGDNTGLFNTGLVFHGRL